MITKKQLRKISSWYYVNFMADVFPISGWKFHIYGTNVDDSYKVGVALESIITKYKLGMKIAAERNIQAGIGNPKHPNYGKIATIYLVPELFRKKLVISLLEEMKTALLKINYTKEGTISGDRKITGNIHYRYELSKPIDCTTGLTYSEYINLYQSNRGEYNIPGNLDPIEEYIKP